MQILIICGFLGAGKTRFIKELVKRTGKFFAILENEFGALNIDSQTLKKTEVEGEVLADKACESLRIWELTEGCICCSTNLDFTASVLTIANTVNPDYLLIEPSGVAMPSRLIQKLQTICYEQISLLAPITIIDGQNFRLSKADFPAYFKDQIWQSGTVIVSKSEDFSLNDFTEIKRELNLPEDVNFPLCHYSQFTNDQFLSLLDTELVLKSKSSNSTTIEKRRFRLRKKDQPLDLTSLSYQNVSVKSADQLVAYLEIMIRGAMGKIARAKGYVHLANQCEMLHFELVSGTYTIYGISDAEDLSADVVVIGKDLQKQSLDELWLGTITSRR